MGILDKTNAGSVNQQVTDESIAPVEAIANLSEGEATEEFSSVLGGIEPEITTLVGSDDQLTIASFDVANLDPHQEAVEGVAGNNPNYIDDDLGEGRFDTIAAQIVNQLQSPDIIALQGVQDNDGAEISDVVDASLTYQTLIDAIVAAGGPEYTFFDIPPENGQDGGQPGGNVRSGYLYNPQRLSFIPESGERIIDPDLFDGNAFQNSPKPLVAKFEFNQQEVFIINNHFSGSEIPSPLDVSSDVQRAQAQLVNNYIDSILESNPQAKAVVLADLSKSETSSPTSTADTEAASNAADNPAASFSVAASEFFSPWQILQGEIDGEIPVLTDLSDMFPKSNQSVVSRDLPTDTRVLVSENLAESTEYDVINGIDQSSDRNSSVVRLNIPESLTEIIGTSAGDLLIGTDGDDLLKGLKGRDTLIGGLGDDILVGGMDGDILTGGEGADQFVFNSFYERTDLITDFNVSEDKLILTDVVAGLDNYQGTDPIADGYMRFFEMGSSVWVQFDVDGSEGPAVFTTLVELDNLLASATTNDLVIGDNVII